MTFIYNSKVIFITCSQRESFAVTEMQIELHSFRPPVSCDSAFFCKTLNVIVLHLPLMSCSVAATRMKQLRKITVLKMNRLVHVVFLLLPFILLCESGLEFVVYHFQNTSWRLLFAYKVDYSLRSVPHARRISSLL